MHRDLTRYVTFLAVVRVVVLLCTPLPAVPAPGCVQGVQQRDRGLLRDVITRRAARPRSAPGPPGHPGPALTCDVTAPEAPRDPSPVHACRPQPATASTAAANWVWTNQR